MEVAMKLTKYAAVAGSVLLLAIGCDRPTEKTRKTGADVEVDAPGVRVDVDKRDGVKVDAPGVRVDVDKNSKQ
jgi:hypothetical protein